MAALINRPMYEHFGARHLGVKGPGAMTTLEEGVMGTIPLDLMGDFSYWHLQGFRTYSASVSQGPSAGLYSTVGLCIENNSDLWLSRIIAIDLSARDAEFWVGRCARGDFSSDPGVHGYGTDTRIPEAQPSQSVLLNGDIAATPGQALSLFDNAAEQIDIVDDKRIPLLVSPGQCIYVQHSQVNVNVRASFCWVEIPAYKAEL